MGGSRRVCLEVTNPSMWGGSIYKSIDVFSIIVQNPEQATIQKIKVPLGGRYSIKANKWKSIDVVVQSDKLEEKIVKN